MKIQDYIEILNTQIPRLYSFVYAIIPDDLQAGQILIDAFAIHITEEREDFTRKNIWDTKDEVDLYLDKLQLGLYIKIFQLALKRSQHLASGPMGASNDEARVLVDKGIEDHQRIFYHLDAQERALFYLKYRENRGLDTIQSILKLGRIELLSLLHRGRARITGRMGIPLDGQWPARKKSELAGRIS